MMAKIARGPRRGLAWLLALGAALPASAHPVRIEDDEDAEEEPADEAEEEDRWLAIVGGDVVTGTGAVLAGASITAKNGVVEEVGYDLWYPEDAEVLDARGLRVYPGLVAITASSRIVEGSNPFFEPGEAWVEGVDEEELAEIALEDEDDEEGGSLGTGVDESLADSYDPFGYQLVLTLSTGITTVGQSKATFKLKRGELEGVVIAEDRLKTLTWSTGNPRSKSDLREKFDRAAEYLREYRVWEKLVRTDKELPEPSKRGVDSSVLDILQGRQVARFNANQREELLGIARLAQRYGFRPVIFGCREGWTVADELGRAGASAVITPRDTEFREEHLNRPGGTSIENAAILHRSGVQVAIIPSDDSVNLGGIAGRDLLHLPIEAAFAIRGGLPESAALEAITVVPARMLGVDHRVGTIEPGKDCDVLIADGDLLHYETFVQTTVVEGKVVYEKDEELFFAHIRPVEDPVEEVWDAGEGPGEVEPAAPEEPAAEPAEETPEDPQESAEDAR